MDIEWAKDGVTISSILFRHVLKQFMGKIKNKCEIYKLKKVFLSHRESH
jgi:hypothetical protein